MSEKTNTLYEGELKNYDNNEKYKMCEEILHYIKEKGLTASQAINLLTDVIDMIPRYATLISIADYEKITGKNIC